ncbi:hypothetical protein IMCC1989_2466 [gamma proteobacterium IMCC1989]|nr:hypothetical protein IMCC1989_2466 [gamma proteobacterium IMCC1989]
MKFRKSIKIAKGVRVNFGKKGISSLSFGGKGLTFNASEKGIKVTGSLPGTGLSHSEMISKSNNKNSSVLGESEPASYITLDGKRFVSPLLWLGIFSFPYVFSWFTLRAGHSTTSKVFSFGWLLFLCFLIIKKP